MLKKLNEENIDEILNFIEKELRNTNCPVYADISRKILDIYGVDVYPAKVAQICRKINEEKGLNLNLENKKQPLTKKKLEYKEDCKEADLSGITDEEIYLCRLRGYSYGVMNRIYFELTGKLLTTDYFAKKYMRYCKEHHISILECRNAKGNPNAFQNITQQDLEKHSSFFRKMYLESRIRNTATQRNNSTKKLLDPYKKLHEEMQSDTTILDIDRDDR